MATEKRLIDANAFRKSVMGWKLGKIPKGELLWDLDRQPTVDAKETVYGQWKLIPNHEALGFCSVCKYKPAFVSYKYCPNCGADMRGNDNG